MVAQSIANRPSRAKQAEPDDAVIAGALQFAEWAKRNVILIVVSAIVLVVGVGGFFWYRADQAQQQEQAALAFLQVEQAVMSGDEGIATRELQLFIQQHGETTYGQEARMLLAQVHLRAGRSADAIQVVEPVAQSIRGSELGAQAALLLAVAQAEAGQTEEAIQTYVRVGDEAEMAFRQQEGLMGAALLREEMGDHAGAVQLYERLLTFAEEGSADRSFYEMRLAEARARAAAAQ